MNSLRKRLLVLLLLVACGGQKDVMKNGTPETADLVLEGGAVYTMNPLAPRADAVAVRDGLIQAVGSSAEIRRLVGPKTRVIELAGRALTPGLVDAHSHLHGLGKAQEDISLRGVKSAAACAEQVAKVVAARSPGEWIEGRGWDQNLWPSHAFPGHELLDAVAPKNPVSLRRIDGHALWANAAALREAGVNKDTRDPAGGKIVRDAAGEPTGVLIDTALELVEGKIPPPPAETRRRRILAAAALAVQNGLTGATEMGIGDGLVADYRALAAEGRLPLRVVAYWDGSQGADKLVGRRPDVDRDGRALFALVGVKLYADGALGSRGAALLAPYSDDPGNRGLVVEPKETIQHAAEICLAGGWQLAVHAIGDRANRDVLDAFEAAHVTPAARFRIEHAQVVAPGDFARFARLGVLASMQPTHATSDMPWAGERLGPERLKGAYAWRTMLKAGVHVVGGSDFPIEEVAPLRGVYAAVTRQDDDGRPEGGWLPEQRLGLDEALRLYTVEPAYAVFQEHHRGQVVPGFVADLTVLDRDLLPDRSLLQTRVDLTIVGGVIVYDSSR